MSRECRIVTGVGEAAALLAAGGVVAFPTETVYGLGADAANPEAVERIFRIKGRPADHPLIVHLGEMAQMRDWALDIPEEAYLLAKRFWPGPLTLILRRDSRVPGVVTGGQDTVGLRIPGHPVALDLLRRFGGGIAAPSANRFGRISPTTARHVFEELGDRLELIVDSGPCRIGLESTIVSLAGARPQLLRPGAISVAEIEGVLGGGRLSCRSSSGRLRAPGMHRSHYAPRKPFRVIEWAMIRESVNCMREAGSKVVVITFQSRVDDLPDNVAFQVMPGDPDDYARELYAVMRALDNGDFDSIVADAPPDVPRWQAVRDRLYRAAG